MYRPIADVLKKGGVIVYTAPHATVFEAVERMAFHNVGSILILRNHRVLEGIFTERDLLRRVVLEGRDPRTTPISEVMTRDVIVVSSDTPRHEVERIMREHHIRHVPIADEERILGVVSLRDVLRVDRMEKDFEIDKLKEYVLDKPYPTYPG
ncbi:MAG: inosine-5-monophosphate dehydrogenase [Rhodothermaceae bacterium]|nr:MAG: CBS domain-containing protein [Bacteroidota bacterium]GIV62643.1 MAG: inosine-5-monophosphate dehydrogenase [Rhodothermaceae bacterium]